MRRPTGAPLLTVAAAAAVLLLSGCAATGTVTRADGPVIGTSPVVPAPTPEPVADDAEPTEEEDTPAPASTGADTDGACGPEQVQTEVAEVSPSASNRSLTIFFANMTTAPCRLSVPPIVELLGPDGAGVPTTIVPGTLPEYRGAGADEIPAQFRVFVGISWRVVPATADADPAVDCVPASAIRVRLTADSPPIDVPVNLTACERGTLIVDPYDIDAG